MNNNTSDTREVRMKYNVVFASGRRFDNMTPAEFYVFFHGYHGLDYTVYNKQGVIVGPFDPSGKFIGQ